MNILALDTSGSCLSIAFADDERTVAERTIVCGRRHAELLFETLDQTLAAARATLQDIDLLAVTSGPGSFTGLRIGLSHGKGLALALRVPLIPVPTLDALVRNCRDMQGDVCALLDARMSEVFTARFEVAGGEARRLTPDRVCSIEAALEGVPDGAVFLGDGAPMYREQILANVSGARVLDSEAGVLQASQVAAEALRLYRSGQRWNTAEVAPVYLRQSQPEELRKRLSAQAPVS